MADMTGFGAGTAEGGAEVGRQQLQYMMLQQQGEARRTELMLRLQEIMHQNAVLTHQTAKEQYDAVNKEGDALRTATSRWAENYPEAAFNPAAPGVQAVIGHVIHHAATEAAAFTNAFGGDAQKNMDDVVNAYLTPLQATPTKVSQSLTGAIAKRAELELGIKLNIPQLEGATTGTSEAAKAQSFGAAGGPAAAGANTATQAGTEAQTLLAGGGAAAQGAVQGVQAQAAAPGKGAAEVAQAQPVITALTNAGVPPAAAAVSSLGRAGVVMPPDVLQGATIADLQKRMVALDQASNAIDQALALIDKNPQALGLAGSVRSTVGGFAEQARENLPVVGLMAGALAKAFGMGPEDTAKIQATKGGLSQMLLNLSNALTPERLGFGGKWIQEAIADAAKVTELSATPEGAKLALSNLKTAFTGFRAMYGSQLDQRRVATPGNAVPPVTPGLPGLPGGTPGTVPAGAPGGSPSGFSPEEIKAEMRRRGLQ